MNRLLLSLFIFTSLNAATLADTRLPGEPASPIPREAATLETISITGLGKITLIPDRVTFTAGVQTIAPAVPDAVNQNNDKLAAVIAALKEAGATDAEIQTSNFSIYPQQEYLEGRAPRVTGYQVSNDITVTRNEVSDAGKLLQAAISAGVNQASGLSFSVADQTRGRDEALRMAFDDARAKAQILANAAQRTLGRAMSITEGLAPQGPIPLQMREMAVMDAKQSSEVPVSQGSQELQFTVSVIFELL